MGQDVRRGTGACVRDKALEAIERHHRQVHRRQYVHPDPLEFLYEYPAVEDREIAALVVSSLAYGRVGQILKSVSLALGLMPCPASFLRETSAGALSRTFTDFKHRFTTGEELSRLLLGIKGAIERYGSLQACFGSSLDGGEETVLPALSAFVEELNRGAGGPCGSLLPLPHRGSACKRLNLFLRWMVRSDGVDPGGWTCVAPAKLIIPLDTHMHRIGLMLGFTKRRQANMRTALEITSAFRAFAPDDPVKYDFSLTRLGIRDDMDIATFGRDCGISEVA